MVVQVLGDGPGQRDAVVGAGAAADLVEDDQAARRGVVEDVGRLGHLHHERALPPAQFVAGADAREDAIGQADASPAGRHEAAHLGQERQQRDLADVDGVMVDKPIAYKSLSVRYSQVVDCASPVAVPIRIVKVVAHMNRFQFGARHVLLSQ